MRSLLVLLRILIVGCLWSIVFIEGIRVIMLCNWHFDIFWPEHWRQAYTLWKAGWTVSAPKEWAFVLIIITFFPMLITGWWTLTLVAWEKIIYDIIIAPATLYRRLIKAPINVITTSNKYGVVKKKSYKQIRPAGVTSMKKPISDYNDNKSSSTISSMGGSQISPMQSSVTTSQAPKSTSLSATLDHALFKFDDDDDDFDLDIESFEKSDFTKKTTNKSPISDDSDVSVSEQKNKPAKDNSRKQKKSFDFDDEDEELSKSSTKNRKSESKDKRNKNKSDRNNRNNKDNETADNKNGNKANSSHGPVYDVLQQKGYKIINNISVKDTQIDFVAVSESDICLCLVDKENGDWLADEELFNGEEPLWFSENSHRVSPVRKLDIARNLIVDKLSDEGFEQNVKSFVIVQMANIINADDMFEIWNGMDIKVTRINRGAPKEINLFTKSIGNAEGTMPREDFDKLCNLLKNIN